MPASSAPPVYGRAETFPLVNIFLKNPVMFSVTDFYVDSFSTAGVSDSEPSISSKFSNNIARNKFKRTYLPMTCRNMKKIADCIPTATI